jgi:hypothetical protein
MGFFLYLQISLSVGWDCKIYPYKMHLKHWEHTNNIENNMTFGMNQ